MKATRKSMYNSKDQKRYLEIDEPASFRTPWRRDYGRTVHSPSFRRLQGKAQLFLGGDWNSRNRLTHSIEVAQVAKSIAQKLNDDIAKKYGDKYDYLKINEDIVEVAGLLHDIGHPPFGHNGERALNDCMQGYGGFEGNAQTLRIIARIEKKELPERPNTQQFKGVPLGFDNQGKDIRVGLNLTYRVLASVLKYDNAIPQESKKSEVIKGYYSTEAEIVEAIKKNVYKSEEYLHEKCKTWKTVECQIMEIADDIANAAYDLEDAFKLNLLTPLDLISDRYSKDVHKKMEALHKDWEMDLDGVYQVLYSVAEPAFRVEPYTTLSNKMKDLIKSEENPQLLWWIHNKAVNIAKRIATDGYLRIDYTSQLVNKFIKAVKIDINEEYPPFSKIYLEEDVEKQVAVLKQFSYVSIVESSRIRVPEYRGYYIVSEIYKALTEKGKKGTQLLPKDIKEVFDFFEKLKDSANNCKKEELSTLQQRLIADFIAGMTDAFAVEFHNRLHSDNPKTIFDPLG